MRYSSHVVEATTFKSPLVSAGLSILARSFELPWPPAPAPLIICASSINIIVLPCFVSPCKTSLKRSSKSPRYFEPASIAPISRLYTLYSFKKLGTSSCSILNASPSAIAVLPTPGSPTISTLFLALRPSASASFSNSSVRPIIGSTLPFLTSSLRLVVNARSALRASADISSPSCSSITSLSINAANFTFSIPAFSRKYVQILFFSESIASNTSVNSM